MTTNRFDSKTNSDIVITLDANEAIPAGTPRQMGFRLTRGPSDKPMWRSEDYSFRELAEQVSAAGFSVDPNTMKIGFVKTRWDGDFGAYEERPGQNRPAFGVGIDFRKAHPTMAPRQFTAGIGSGQTAFSARISSFHEFRGSLYVAIAGRSVYKLENWSGSGEGSAYFTLVFTHSNAGAILRDLKVYDNVLYVAAGETAAYAYSSDGSSWTESNRGDPHDKAEQFMVLNGTLHKIRTPNLHYQTTNGQNGGEAWSSADEFGDTLDSPAALEMAPVENQMAFATEEGWLTLDAGGNTFDMYPELKRLSDSGNGFHAFIWNKVLFYPTLRGELLAFAGGQVYNVHPAHKQERNLETDPISTGVFIGRIRAMAGTTDYLYVEIQRPSDNSHRIVMLEMAGDRFTWRTLVDVSTTTSDELWITSRSTSGHVLWATTGINNYAAYWVLPSGPDQLQDTRVRYGASGTIYEPWLTFGCPTTLKRPEAVEVGYSGNGSGGSIVFRLVAEDGTSTQRTISGITGPGFVRFLLPKAFIHYRYRIEWEYGTENSSNTPYVTWYKMTVFALPEPTRVFHLTIDTDWAGRDGGATTQMYMREFLDQLRRCRFPFILKDMFHERSQGNNREWSVIRIPPTPVEDMMLSPEESHQWDSVWPLTLIEVPTREFEILNPLPDDEEPPGEESPLPPGEGPDPTGGRVYVSGHNVTGGAPRFWWTEDFYAASPDWTENSTGLPAAATTAPVYVVIDPWNPSTRGLILLRNDSTSSWEIYYNSAMRTGGTWTKVFDVATYNTLAGTAVASINIVGSGRGKEINYSIAQEDVWGFLVQVSGTRLDYIHTHNNGSSFTLATIPLSGGAGDSVGNACSVWGQHDATKVYAAIGSGGYDQVWRSDDSGHTFTSIRRSNGLGSRHTEQLHLPYEANPTDSIPFFLGYSNPVLFRSIDEGVTTVTVADGSLISVPNTFRLWRADLTGFGIGIDRTVNDAYYTENGGQSWTKTVGGLPTVGWDLSMLRTNILYLSGGAGAVTGVYSSTDWVTFTSRQGDLPNSFTVHAIVPDFSL